MSPENPDRLSRGNIIQHQHFEGSNSKDSRQWRFYLDLLSHSNV